MALRLMNRQSFKHHTQHTLFYSFVLFVLFFLFVVVVSDGPGQKQGRGLVDHKLVQTPQ